MNFLFILLGIFIGILLFSLYLNFCIHWSKLEKTKRKLEEIELLEKQKLCDHLGVKYFESQSGDIASNPFCSKCGKELEGDN